MESFLQSNKALASLDDIKAARDKDPDDLQAIKNLRNTQAKLRLMQSELNIEEVVKERSIKVFHEKCRNHFIPKTSAGTGL
ncbi:putative coiled-coil domain-containing protein [Apostichopus japonicus]|uniref:Protein MIX23 n=1 Tax=Stichopus japonicus TaxID=307972 RepID=A0A2G8JCQ9_STIJA|nr:putative coiled-coil domain-containing protein [Apostichopus japonicus]